MNDRSPYRALATALVVLAAAAAIGIGAYQAGVAHGVAEAGAIAVPPEATGTHVYVMAHPWHGFFPFGPLFGLLIAFLVVRALLWGGPWRRGGCHGRGDRTPPPPDPSGRA